ncbi:MAG TPA: hypothetical protein VGJ29_08045 [Vicinamibacterales bacterium]|jgi:hypothetical protein
MTVVAALWLPILLSAVLVFVASSIIHMASPWHKSDYPKMPNEDGVMDALRPFAIPPGDYMTPRPSSREDMRSQAFADKMTRGPIVIMTVLPSGMMSMSRNFVLWFAYTLTVSFFTAYVVGHAVPYGSGQRPVIRFAGVTAFIAYSAALWQMSIWYRRSWSTTMKATIDGLIYALVTAFTFAWLWPR